MRVLLVVALLLGGSAWAQARSIEGAGRITLTAGPRYVDKSYFAGKAAANGTPLVSQWPVGPSGVASFAYGATSWIEVAIELFGAFEQFAIEGDQPFDSVTYGLHLVARASQLDVLVKGLSPYLGVGAGPTLVLMSSSTRPAGERVETGMAVMGGFTLALTDTLGLAVDVRWMWARGVVQGISGVNAGGVTASVGVVFLFPPAPKRDLRPPGF